MATGKPMKLLLVARSQHRPKTFADGTLKFISRAGYNYRIYIKISEAKNYRSAIDQSKYNNYLFIPNESIIEVRNTDKLPKYVTEYETKKYDLLLELPDDVRKMKGARGIDNQLLLFCREVGRLRNKFNKNPDLCEIDAKKIHKEAFMVRLK